MHTPSDPTRCLILGGTSEASALARLLAGDERFAPLLSFAGRTRSPVLPPIPCRTGGFGGASGLAAMLEQEGMHALIDATHPFAARISANAAQAIALRPLPFLGIVRPAWQPVAGDRWQMVDSLEEAAAALGIIPRRIFLTIGRQELAPFRACPWHHYVIRSVDAPEPHHLPPQATVLTARGPFATDDEIALLRSHRIDGIVTKNAGGSATEAKLAACRALGLPVWMVRRPAIALPSNIVTTAQEAMRWLEMLHHERVTERGA
ncbi:cobalt-precorrin-6A reductase [Granulibacter bethesdensis]|uniref:cobalt-precorrin-6A reductase n=1 Tax=Granulibacter bethesdensis TaxID=364410 RepID=UPI00046CBAC0|nr:cobalt-precorrin-6A reductase [Granulibacter bethesdensis]